MATCSKCKKSQTECACVKTRGPSPVDSLLTGIGAAMSGGMGHAMAAAMEGQDRRRIVDAMELIALSLFESIPPVGTGMQETVTRKRAAEIAGRIALAKRPDATIAETMAGDGSRTPSSRCRNCGGEEWMHSSRNGFSSDCPKFEPNVPR